MLKLEIEIWYENHEGEIRSTKQMTLLKKGDTPLWAITQFAHDGFVLKTANRGIYRFIPPHRILSITYPE